MTPPHRTHRAVVVTSRSFSTGSADLTGRLTAAGLTVLRADPGHDPAALRGPLGEAVAWIAGTAPVTAAHLALAPALSVLARHGVGVDAVDLDAARDSGVTVTHTPGANSEAVAEHTLALLLAALRAVPAGDARVRAGVWTVTRGRQLGAAVAGVVGFGRIGRGVTERLRALGCTVLVHDPYVPDDAVRAAGARPVPLDELRSAADVVALHTPGGRLLVDADWTAAARDGQVIVNTARADLVDETAVADALRSGRLFGYAADTLATESRAAHSPLLADDLRDRVVVTPHLGAQTEQAVDRMGTMAVDGVLDVLAGRRPRYPVGAEPSPGGPAGRAVTGRVA
ncbi:NAD(P)-dependent oxidoreductase [Streptomyces odontomachi]|uniref:NAD(P)-dependent oxidoreductase n=1 Tax=Streptomyces odontomachi TaxID=2944940 RepID=UPI00210C7767|nr:NAD(P)-dependent oxidoreductase [Streptomyces sp. ODS25]